MQTRKREIEKNAECVFRNVFLPFFFFLYCSQEENLIYTLSDFPYFHVSGFYVGLVFAAISDVYVYDASVKNS